MDYSKTLQLPANVFPMRANLPEREPQMQKGVGRTRYLFQSVKEERKGREVHPPRWPSIC